MNTSKPIPTFTGLLRSRNTFALKDFLPVCVSGKQIGFLHRCYKDAVVTAHPAVQYTANSIAIALPSNNRSNPQSPYRALTRLFEDINKTLVQKGLLTPSHPGEMYRVVTDHFSQPLFEIARYAALFWGIRIFAVPLNGLVQKEENQVVMWYSRRSNNRAAPGKLDHLVCGGQPANITLRDNLCKEAYEEAKIPAELAQKAIPTGIVSHWEQHEHYLYRFTPVMFDLWLPESFTPISYDGSSSAFATTPLSHLKAHPEVLLDFKSACQPVLINLLLRHGYFQPDEEHYITLCTGLLQGFFPYTTEVW